MQLPSGKKIYFLSDFHLGAPDYATSLIREKRVVEFLEEVRHDAAIIFIVGDIFDFWYEYRTVVPKGYVRLLGKLAELTDAGISIQFFVGNHDMWMKDYFQHELNIPVFFEPKTYQFGEVKMLIGHGDGLGPGDHGYKFLKKILRNPICQWLFGILPPVVGISLAGFSSRKSRAVTGDNDGIFLGEEKEWLIQYCKETLATQHFDYLIFGHRHLPIDFQLGPTSRYVNLGDWIRYYTYAVFDGQQMTLQSRYPELNQKIVRKP
ncbi:MAG: UDP-2,3-diacylglucosamine diphosphatase [Chitinophagaceae bacterium]|nr:UDP-2,3-diacylglucosamine diphosphatase [Chitinophagaceae bacterium]